jgi:hypothetical protein
MYVPLNTSCLTTGIIIYKCTCARIGYEDQEKNERRADKMGFYRFSKIVLYTKAEFAEVLSFHSTIDALMLNI